MKLTRHATLFTLFALSLALLVGLAARGGPALAAQGGCGPGWTPVNGDGFFVRMPARVSPAPSDLAGAPGQTYRASSRGVTYTLWVVRDADPELGVGERLTNFRTLFWQARQSRGGRTTLKQRGEVPLNGFPGQQFDVNSGGARGRLNVYARGDKIYALEVTPLGASDSAADCFLDTLRLSALPPPPTRRVGGGGGGGGRRGTDPPPPPPPTPEPTPRPNVYECECGAGLVKETEGDESNHDLVLCPYPQMDYPKWVRQEGYEGTGSLRVLFPSSGPPKVLEVLKGVHPALTQSAIKSVESTKFCPAVLDGVSQDMEVEIPFKFDLITTTVPQTPTPPRRRPRRP